LGYFYQNKIMIIQRKTKEKRIFNDEVRKVIQNLPRPFYSYNSKFERDTIESELGMKLPSSDFVDLMDRWKSKAQSCGRKWPKLEELISEPEDYFKDNKISGKDVPRLWKDYLSGATSSVLKSIIEHNLSDLLREAILLIRYEL